MGKATGIFLILAGIGTAALVLPAVDTDAERQLADVVHIATGATPQAANERPAVVVAPIARTNKTADAAATVAPRVIRPAERPANVATATSDSPRQPVLVAPPQVVVRNAVAVPARQADEQARQGLTRDIQRELKRVGCYDGDVSGEWSPRTRQAMKAFIDRVNAALPVDEPDHILRTMVQGHPGHACGQACTAGQTANNQGRCLPTGIVAQNSSGSQQPKIAFNDNRTRDGGVPSRDIAAARPSVPKPTWETTVAAASPRATDPVNLEGRMAVGRAMSPSASGSVAVDLVPAGSAAAGSISSGFNKPAHMIVPGAIAAFGGKSIATSALGPGLRPATNSDAQGVAASTQRPSTVGQPESGGIDQQTTTRGNDRPRPAKVYRAPEPEKFRFPPPAYQLGVRPPSYQKSYETQKASSFSRIFERLSRETR